MEREILEGGFEEEGDGGVIEAGTIELESGEVGIGRQQGSEHVAGGSSVLEERGE